VIDPIRWWHSHSVRMRLAVWYVAAMVVVLAVYAGAIYTFVSRSVSESLDERLRADFFWAAASVDLDADGEVVMTTPQVDLLLEEEPWVQVWSAGGGDLLHGNAEARRRPIAATQQLAATGQDRTATFDVGGVPMRVLSRRSYIGQSPVIVQVGRSEEPMWQQMRDLLLVLLLGLPLAVGVAGLGGYVLARRALAPIEQMTERARSITAERLSDRLPVKHPDDEMGRLASVFNETLARLEASFAQMRQFTADVSHELRTPLTSIRSVGEVGLRGQRDEHAYRGIIESMLEEVDRLAGLVDRLLTLSRAETGQAALSREIVHLQALAEEVVQHLSVLAEEKQQQIVVERRAAPDALADKQVLRHALINLVDNAIKFTPRGGSVRIRISETPASAIFDVIDTGPGVPEASRAHIFDRFYRADESDGVRGAGLGLSIAKGAVEANGGRLTLEASSPSGSTFRITMPRVAPARRQAG
jgi:heavy metal sensor kinase